MSDCQATKPEENMRLIEMAREEVAGRIVQPYNQRAVLNGEWDSGFLVQTEIQRLTELMPLITEEAVEAN